ncbi:hypothetical protein FEM48_Zijuj02G0065200 [Ziziphus jujuba var. spinosa]|uniref:SHSP domain-containing protein n=1 Tax=Ziziphus jujuba var. spinosa TaxID=714518 RepID=A0A978VU66_ZIZJJ|nr:hypothetical protein FEM48_Zijuj02G0065200 [Ziziphus jujuba var. spinosa]
MDLGLYAKMQASEVQSLRASAANLLDNSHLGPIQGFSIPLLTFLFFPTTFSGKLCIGEHPDRLEGDPTSPCVQGRSSGAEEGGSEVKVEIEDYRMLRISGERNVEKEAKNDTWHRVESSSGKFQRRFRLPENAKMEDVKASMENGVLTVTVPKLEVKKPDVKAIEISG